MYISRFNNCWKNSSKHAIYFDVWQTKQDEDSGRSSVYLEIVCTVHLKYLDNHIISNQNSRIKKVQKWSLQECTNVIFLNLHHDPSLKPIKVIFWKNDDLKRSSVKQANNTFSAVAEQGGRCFKTKSRLSYISATQVTSCSRLCRA